MSDPAATWYLKDYATIFALFSGPVIAVMITFWKQKRDQKRNAKERLFITLMGHRKSIVPTQDWATALNLIDVVYADHPNIVKKWHDALDLLASMAQVLGHKSLNQTDIDKFYTPQIHGDQSTLQTDLQNELLRVLKATAHMGMTSRDDVGDEEEDS
jgi:hypothetical protein